MSVDYKSTIILPRTDFPMRAGLPKREPEILDRWAEMDLFSRLRQSKFRENVQWVKFQIRQRESAGKLPTRVALYDLAAERLVWDINMEEHQCNAVFSILPAD